MRELWKKKVTKIGIAVIILAVASGIIGINASSAQRQREYEGHIEAAEKYLTELDYEQAIAEYTLALEIEPNSEDVLNALEQTYLDYAQSLADAGEYEKAVSVLEEGYAQTGRESLREKMEDLRSIQEQIIEFPFELTDITIMGYDLFDDHFGEICAAYGCPVDPDPSRTSNRNDSRVHFTDNEYGYLESSVIDDGEYFQLSLTYWDEQSGIGNAFYMVFDDQDGLRHRSISISVESPIAADLESFGIRLPVPVNSSEEDWNRVMQVQEIKEKGEQHDNENGSSWFFQTKWGGGMYSTHSTSDKAVTMRLDAGEQNIEGIIYHRQFWIRRRNDGFVDYQLSYEKL